MRKFIIKNRPKRKYTKKSEQNSSLLFGKTFVGILPPVIMIIALMATVVITAPAHNPLADIKFNFDLSNLSLRNPLSLLQQYGNTMQDMYGIISIAVLAFFATVFHTSQSVAAAGSSAASTLDPRPLFVSLGASIITAGNAFFSFLQTCFLYVQMLLSQMFTAIVFAFNIIGANTVIVFHGTIYGLSVGIHAITAVILFIYHGIVNSVQAFFGWVWFVRTAFTNWLTHTTQSLVRAIEWPFQAAGAYLSQYKPMTDILGQHMMIALNDTGACFANLSKTFHSIGSSK